MHCQLLSTLGTGVRYGSSLCISQHVWTSRCRWVDWLVYSMVALVYRFLVRLHYQLCVCTAHGIVLAGGGMRAAFLHLGFLAKLAEAGILPAVEAVSCVSAGSIIAGFYYFCLRQLLEAKPETEITKCVAFCLMIECLEHKLTLSLLSGKITSISSNI